MKRKNNPAKHPAKPFEGERDKAWAQKRLVDLDTRLGAGTGAKRERERIQGIIDYESTPMSKRAFASKAEERRHALAEKAKKIPDGTTVDAKGVPTTMFPAKRAEVLTPEEDLRREIRKSEYEASKKGKRNR